MSKKKQLMILNVHYNKKGLLTPLWAWKIMKFVNSNSIKEAFLKVEKKMNLNVALGLWIFLRINSRLEEKNSWEKWKVKLMNSNMRLKGFILYIIERSGHKLCLEETGFCKKRTRN